MVLNLCHIHKLIESEVLFTKFLTLVVFIKFLILMVFTKFPILVVFTKFLILVIFSKFIFHHLSSLVALNESINAINRKGNYVN